MNRFSKIILIPLAAMWLTGCNQAQQNNSADEKAIRTVAQAFQEAFNKQDAATMAAQWTSDASYLNPVTGESAEGREAIEKLFKDKFAKEKKRRLEITIKSIEFPGTDEAIENGVMKMTIEGQPAQQLAYEMGYVKENGKWFVNSINEIQLQEAPSHFEQLKELAFLIGKWQDSDDNVDILFDTQWDKYKNFITQAFTMKVLGQDDIEGKQIIAWDAVNNVIRSWIFDSDGGYGEGKWEKLDKSWYAAMKFNLGDGAVASATNIYTPVNANSYTFASVEREADGEILPDLDPVTVEKVE